MANEEEGGEEEGESHRSLELQLLALESTEKNQGAIIAGRAKDAIQVPF